MAKEKTTPATETALYRKYRPKKWDDVIGQDHVVRALEGALKNEAISHAYLFSGTRGTGKTSVARIFAEAIGCTPNDLYEIDAASNRGIDDIRELRESVSTLPFESPYKVYIIDEVHMLTKEAFNALLKTLEEPPSHAVFVLATTELEKLPDTVVSRCQTFVFKKPSREMLRQVVTDIAKQEGFALEAAAADLIALLGDGSFRDTEGILQKVLAAGGGSGGKGNAGAKITAKEVETLTGAPRGSLINEFISALEQGGDAGRSAALKAVHTASAQNVDMKTFLKLVLHKVRLILLVRFARDMEADIRAEVGDDDFAFLKKVADTAGSRITSATLVELLNAYDQIGHAYLPELPLELAVMRILGNDAEKS